MQVVIGSYVGLVAVRAESVDHVDFQVLTTLVVVRDLEQQQVEDVFESGSVTEIVESVQVEALIRERNGVFTYQIK